MTFVFLLALVLCLSVAEGQVVGQSNYQGTSEAHIDTGYADNPGKPPKTTTPYVTQKPSPRTTTRPTTTAQATTQASTKTPPSQYKNGQVTTSNYRSTNVNEANKASDQTAYIETAQTQYKAGSTNGKPVYRIPGQSSSTGHGGLNSATNTLNSAYEGNQPVIPDTKPEQMGYNNSPTKPSTHAPSINNKATTKYVYDSPHPGKVSAVNAHNSQSAASSGYDNPLQRDYVIELAYDNILSAPVTGTDHAHSYMSQANMLLGKLYAIINFQPVQGLNEVSVQNSFKGLIKSLTGIVNHYDPHTTGGSNTHHQETQYSGHNSPSTSQPLVQHKIETTTQASYGANLFQQMTDFSGLAYPMDPKVDQAVTNYQANQMVDKAVPNYQVDQMVDKAMPIYQANQMVDKAVPNYQVDQMVDKAMPIYQANQMVDKAVPNYQANQMVDKAVPNYQANQMVDKAMPNYQVSPMVDQVVPSYQANQMVNQAVHNYQAPQMVEGAGEIYQTHPIVDQAGESFHANQVDQAVESYQTNLNRMADQALPEYQQNHLMIDPLANAYNHVPLQETTPKPPGKYILFNLNAWNITDLNNATSTKGHSSPVVTDTTLSTWYERGLHNGRPNVRVDQSPRRVGSHAYQPDVTYRQLQGNRHHQTSPWLNQKFSGEVETVQERRNMLSAIMMGYPVEQP